MKIAQIAAGMLAGVCLSMMVAAVAMPLNYGSAVLIGTDAGNGITNPISENKPIPISTGDSASMDAAGRFRESAPYGVFEDKRLNSIGSTIWEDAASGVGSTTTWNPNEATVSVTVGTASGAYSYRQSHYIPYVPGKSQLVKITFIAGTGVANVVERVGLFDDNDGLFFQQSGSTLSMCLRSSTSGSPVDTCYPQSSWNLDRLDGTGSSGITFDVTKIQLLEIDYLWQGVGRVRFGFQINGRTYYVHQILNANNLAAPYMATPTLPIRFEVRNLAASAGATLKQICTSVESEGGYALPGFEFAASNGITPVAVTTRAPILAIRLANSYNGKASRRLARALHSSYRATTNDAFCELVHVHNPTATAGGSWVAVNTDSEIEVNTGITSVTATLAQTIDTNYVIAGQGSFAGSVSSPLEWVNEHSFIHQNIASTQSEMFVVYCTAFAGTSNVSAELDWIEAQ